MEQIPGYALSLVRVVAPAIAYFLPADEGTIVRPLGHVQTGIALARLYARTRVFILSLLIIERSRLSVLHHVRTQADRDARVTNQSQCAGRRRVASMSSDGRTREHRRNMHPGGVHARTHTHT